MSKKEMIEKVFRVTYGFLKQLADSTLLLIDRDRNEFNDRGFTDNKHQELSNAIHEFSNFPTDEHLNGVKISATMVKDTNRNALEKQMRTVLLAARTVFGDNSGKYREFGNADLVHETESELVRNANMMIPTTIKYLNELSTEGINLDKVNNLTVAKDNFDNALDVLQHAIYNRDNATEQRAILANKVYELIIKYSNTGKDIWAEVSEAKYNDYVVYDTPSGQAEAAPVVAEAPEVVE
jgi:hypothetical protein